MSRHVAVVCSGGGAKGAFELGALDYLIRDKHVDPDVLTGVSIGALNAAILSQGKGSGGLLNQLNILRELWFSIKSEKDIYKRRLLGFLGLPFRADSIYSNEPLWKLLKKYVDPERLRESGRRLRIGVVNLKTGKFKAVDGLHKDILRYIRASASIPVAFNPVDIDGELYVDGGIINVTPLGTAFKELAILDKVNSTRAPIYRPDTIYVILASPILPEVIGSHRNLRSGISIGMRSLDLLINEIYKTDLTFALAINEGLRYVERIREATGEKVTQLFPGYKYTNIVLIRPKILHMKSLELDPESIRTAFMAGRDRATEAFEAAAETGSNIEPEMMKEW